MSRFLFEAVAEVGRKALVVLAGLCLKIPGENVYKCCHSNDATLNNGKLSPCAPVDKSKESKRRENTHSPCKGLSTRTELCDASPASSQGMSLRGSAWRTGNATFLSQEALGLCMLCSLLQQAIYFLQCRQKVDTSVSYYIWMKRGTEDVMQIAKSSNPELSDIIGHNLIFSCPHSEVRSSICSTILKDAFCASRMRE